MIKIDHLNKKYGKEEVLKDINLKIKDHEFLVLLGPSGCGKTTFLRTISGLEEIDGGDILFNDKSVKNILPKNRNIAMVFQNYALFPDMNVYQNIAFGLQIRKFKKPEIEKMVNDIASKLKIEKLLKRKPSQLSGGEQQRVALARAMVKNPDIYLFDEPLSNLDVNLKDDFMTLIKDIHKETNATFIYVTHAQNEALRLADRIAVMNEGNIIQIDEPHEIYKHPCSIFVANFIGEPKINFIDINNEMKIGIRPENIKIKKENDEEFHLLGKITHSEFLGNGYIHEVDLGYTKIKMFSFNEVEINKEIDLFIDRLDINLFDVGGKAISLDNSNIVVLENKFFMEV